MSNINGGMVDTDLCTYGQSKAGAVNDRRAIILVLAASFLYAINFNLLMSVPPVLVAQRHEGSAGLVTSAHLMAAVVVQWVSPLLVRRWSARQLALGGMVLMGIPSLAYAPASPDVALVFAASVLRGAGFGILTVIGPTMVMTLAPASAVGRSLGSFGVATSVPAIFATALGLHLLRGPYFAVPAILGCVTCVAAAVLIASVPQLRGVGSPIGRDAAPSGTTVLRMLGDRDLRTIALAFALVSVAWGGTTAFLPLILASDGLAGAATFLVVTGMLRVVGRGLAGPWFDRGHSAVGTSCPIIAVMALGLAILVFSTGPATVIASAAIYGVGAGLVQILLFLAINERTPYGPSSASALWSTSLDLGGVVGSGVLAGVAVVGGYSAVLWAMPATVALAIPLLLRSWQLEKRVANDRVRLAAPSA